MTVALALRLGSIALVAVTVHDPAAPGAAYDRLLPAAVPVPQEVVHVTPSEPASVPVTVAVKDCGSKRNRVAVVGEMATDACVSTMEAVAFFDASSRLVAVTV